MTPRRHIAVTEQALTVDDIISELVTPDVGAVVTFVGVVRGQTGGREVEYLEYEAYPEMAEAVLHQIADEVHERWSDIQQMAIVHRVGRLEIGETAVVIVLCAAHRRHTFDALRYTINRLKEIVPIWKKEVWADGYEWKSEQ